MARRLTVSLVAVALLTAVAGALQAPASRVLGATGSVESVVIGTFQPAVSGGACEA